MNPNKTSFEGAWCATWPTCAVLLLMAGCMVGPNYKRPATAMPAAYREPTTGPATAPASAAASAPDEVRWWRTFGDPKLMDLVERSVRANYGIAVAGARVREARAARQVARSLLYPTVG